ncbi:flagellar motor protein MotB [Aurantivibrio infirmus]
MGTFADLMSLLMCFFVLLLSFSEMDALKFKRLAGSMAQAFGVQNKLNVNDIPKGTSIIAQEFSPGKPEPTPINEIWQKAQDVATVSLEVQCAEEYDIEQGDLDAEAGVKARIKEQLEELVKETEKDAISLANTLSKQINEGEIEIETHGRKIIIRIREKGSFRSGSAELSENIEDVITEIQRVLIEKPGKIQIQGHTDNIPIATARYRSNWELSSSRAVTVAHELMDDGLINSRRFEVAGFSDTVPLVPNDTEENRIRNRRVEIVIRQDLGDNLDQSDLDVLREDGQDILRSLDIDPDYLFDLNPTEIF